MGTVPLAENVRVECADGTLVRIEVLTTTGDLVSGEDGQVEVYGYVGGVDAFALYLPIRKFTDLWLARFCDALAAHPGFRVALSEARDADGLVVPAAPVRDTGPLAALVRKGKGAKFKDFAGLRSGRDRYSAMRLPDLEAEAGERACSELDGRLGHVPEADRPAERAKSLRWFLRGLPVSMAVRKVDVDREVSSNASGRGGQR